MSTKYKHAEVKLYHKFLDILVLSNGQPTSFLFLRNYSTNSTFAAGALR